MRLIRSHLCTPRLFNYLGRPLRTSRTDDVFPATFSRTLGRSRPRQPAGKAKERRRRGGKTRGIRSGHFAFISSLAAKEIKIGSILGRGFGVIGGISLRELPDMMSASEGGGRIMEKWTK